MATPVLADLLLGVKHCELRLLQAMRRQWQQGAERSQYQQQRLRSPRQMIAGYWQRLDHREYQLRQIMTHKLQSLRQSLQHLAARLQAISPLATLERGYAVVTYEQKLLSSAEEVEIGSQVAVQLAQGQLNCVVLSKTQDSVCLPL